MMAEKLREYRGGKINVTYALKRCIHAAECVRSLPAVFDTDKRPWVQPDEADADAVAEAVLRCPTGALHFERLDGGEAEVPAAENTVEITPDGPLYLRGDIEIRTRAGERILEDTRVALCRCGASQNKPFCDNSHQTANFSDPAVLGEPLHKDKDSAAEDGRLHVMVRPNGPFMLQGEVTIHGDDGRVVESKTRTALCRCGGSGNKPFCDGSHNQNGFEAD